MGCFELRELEVLNSIAMWNVLFETRVEVCIAALLYLFQVLALAGPAHILCPLQYCVKDNTCE